jgi:hypothetical protein
MGDSKWRYWRMPNGGGLATKIRYLRGMGVPFSRLSLGGCAKSKNRPVDLLTN